MHVIFLGRLWILCPLWDHVHNVAWDIMNIMSRIEGNFRIHMKNLGKSEVCYFCKNGIIAIFHCFQGITRRRSFREIYFLEGFRDFFCQYFDPSFSDKKVEKPREGDFLKISSCPVLWKQWIGSFVPFSSKITNRHPLVKNKVISKSF